MKLEEILKQQACFVYFTSPTCSICHSLKPKLFEAIKNNFEKINVVEIDISKTPDVSANFSVFTIPTALVLFEGKEFIRKSRAFSVDGLMSEIKRPYKIMFG